jgi:hypothetical protein
MRGISANTTALSPELPDVPTGWQGARAHCPCRNVVLDGVAAERASCARSGATPAADDVSDTRSALIKALAAQQRGISHSKLVPRKRDPANKRLLSTVMKICSTILAIGDGPIFRPTASGFMAMTRDGAFVE